MLENPVDHAMVEAINEVGHIMGIKTIAEYVHTRAIVDRLTVIGVDCAQGFAIGEPAPLARRVPRENILRAGGVNPTY
jgi:EAL domain-containing protein (putative c-di-GMP-specific phosphodiesterase class I)